MNFALVTSENQLPIAGTPFSNTSLLRAFAKASQSELSFVSATSETRCEAWIPVFIKKKAGMPMAIHPQLLPYVPVVFHPEVTFSQAHLQEIFEDFAKILTLYSKRLLINLATDFQDIRGFQWKGIKATPRYTYILPLNDDIKYQRLKYRDIKKAGKLNPTVREEFDFELFLKLKKETYELQTKRFPYDDVTHMELLKSLAETGCLKQYILRVEQEDVSTQLILEGDRKIYTWQGFTRRDFLREGITTWFNDYLIRTFRNTHDSFDFCGANIPEIAKYKSGFGGTLTAYYQLQWTASPLLELGSRIVKRI